MQTALKLAQALQPKHVASGGIIYHQGEPPKSMLVVLNGIVAISYYDEGPQRPHSLTERRVVRLPDRHSSLVAPSRGVARRVCAACARDGFVSGCPASGTRRHEITRYCEAGDSFGREELLEGGMRRFTSTAVEDTALMTVGRRAFAEIVGVQQRITLQTKAAFLRRIPGLQEELPWEKAAALFRPRKVRANEVVACEGQPPERIAFIRSGECCVYSKLDGQNALVTHDGRLMLKRTGFVNAVPERVEDGHPVRQQHLLCVLREGQCFADIATLLNQPQRSTVVALTNCILLEVSPTELGRVASTALEQLRDIARAKMKWRAARRAELDGVARRIAKRMKRGEVVRDRERQAREAGPRGRTGGRTGGARQQGGRRVWDKR